jgi:fructose-bisphosphate aldolase class II
VVLDRILKNLMGGLKMVLVPMKTILDAAEKHSFGVGAYNVNYMEQLQGILRAGAETQSPVILQISKTALKYSDDELLTGMIKIAAEEMDQFKDLPIAMHLDHGQNFDIVKRFIDLGGTSVMIDGSLEEDGKTPRSIDDNIRLTKQVVEYAHPKGVTVEGEVGTLGGIEDGIAASKVILSDPPVVKRFVYETGCDAVALAIGTSHGAYKFKVEPKLAMEIIDESYELLEKIAHLVMHGSSSVPKELVDMVNRYVILKRGIHPGYDRFVEITERLPGEKDKYQTLRYQVDRHNITHIIELVNKIADHERLAKTMGVPIPMIQEAIKKGIRKINIDTDGRIATTAAIINDLYGRPGNYDQRKYLGTGREAIHKWVASKMKDFGTAGHAKDVKIVTLEQMAEQYKAA